MVRKIKEYIVSLKVSFITPFGVKSYNEADAEKHAKIMLDAKLEPFKKSLDDIADLEIELDYVERSD